MSENNISVVIPSYKVINHILDVIDGIGPEVRRIYVVDDCCPEGTGAFVQRSSKDSRVVVIFHKENQGVGGAVMTGYQATMTMAWKSSSRWTGMVRWIRS